MEELAASKGSFIRNLVPTLPSIQSSSTSLPSSLSIFTNYPLISAFFAFALAQSIKVFTTWYKESRWDLKQLIGSGGMPSSHSATVTALALAIGLQEGFGGSLFATALILACVVMYDATGVRLQAGRQAEVLNQIVYELPAEHPLAEIRPLRELLGHTPPQVVAGGLLGLTTAIIVHLITGIVGMRLADLAFNGEYEDDGVCKHMPVLSKPSIDLNCVTCKVHSLVPVLDAAETVLNQIVYELPAEHPLAEIRPLRELLGHTPPQVVAGGLLGLTTAIIVHLITGIVGMRLADLAFNGEYEDDGVCKHMPVLSKPSIDLNCVTCKVHSLVPVLDATETISRHVNEVLGSSQTRVSCGHITNTFAGNIKFLCHLKFSMTY
ncbi:unnamed protein product [Ilex paraguariensis]|uniref:Acid phosphatase/vanadium-dependent haloperoxidase-related protein n=1 Tax=Ilex paraguariensis TaxID=185542 RepID=A0ABC8SKY6_9AQUA